MYVQNYKLNNSYTVFVIHDYKKKSKKSMCENNNITAVGKKTEKLAQKTLLPPPANHSLVKHKFYGIGEIVSTDEFGRMNVAFESGTKKFLYPEAFKGGFLSMVQKH